MMREANPFIMPCELVRLINDLCQGDSEKDKSVRVLCYKLLKQLKPMTRAVHEIDKGFWKIYNERNEGWEEKFKNRIRKEYKVG